MHFRFMTLLLAVSLASTPFTADAQGVLGRIKKKAEEAAKKKVEQRTEQAAADATDAVLDRVECKVRDTECVDQAQAEGKQVVLTDDAGKPTGAVAGGAASKGRVGEGAWANYDFKPGDRPLLVDDFSKDEVGDFPRRLELVEGNWEIVEWNGMRLLRGTTDNSTFDIPLPEVLPERFTLEMDVKLGKLAYSGAAENYLLFAGQARYDAQPPHHVIFLQGDDHEVHGSLSAGIVKPDGTRSVTKIDDPKLPPELFPLRVMADGKYVKVYVGSTRVANVPNAEIGRAKTIRVKLACQSNVDDWGGPCFVGNIRVMAGGKKLYDALTEKGRVATQGIYFDSGSDRIRPESTPTLKEIAAMLTEHPDLKLGIEGHTDNVGSAQANHELSHQRAAAVRAYLVSKHSIDEARLTSTGYGDKKPIAKNDTPEGRQQNRRVELVKL